MKNKAHEASQHLTEQAKTQGREQFERYRGSAAGEIEKIAQSAKAAATELENQDRPGLSQYVTSAAQYLSEFADDVRAKNADELFHDVTRMARNNPGLFIAGSVALGFGLMRFAKASSERAQSGDYGSHRPHLRRDHHDRASTHYGDAGHLPSQRELDEHIGSGAGVGTVGSVSNAGHSDLTRPTPTSPAGASAAGSPLTTGSGSTAGRNGKGTDGGLLP
nr:hypothetical protein [Stutzerimonas azotifigens]